MTLHAAHTLRQPVAIPPIAWYAGADGALHGFGEWPWCLCRSVRLNAALSQRGTLRAASCQAVLRTLVGAQPVGEGENREWWGK